MTVKIVHQTFIIIARVKTGPLQWQVWSRMVAQQLHLLVINNTYLLMFPV